MTRRFGAACLSLVAGLAAAGLPRETATAATSVRVSAAVSSFTTSEPATPIEKIRIPAGNVAEYNFTVTSTMTPGTMHGHWKCLGVSAGIKGAIDDKLIRFVLRGPNDRVIQQQDHHPESGSFDVHVERPGTYTFIFDNSGVFRSSGRIVHLRVKCDAD